MNWDRSVNNNWFLSILCYSISKYVFTKHKQLPSYTLTFGGDLKTHVMWHFICSLSVRHILFIKQKKSSCLNKKRDLSSSWYESTATPGADIYIFPCFLMSSETTKRKCSQRAGAQSKIRAQKTCGRGLGKLQACSLMHTSLLMWCTHSKHNTLNSLGVSGENPQAWDQICCWHLLISSFAFFTKVDWGCCTALT